MRLCYTAAMQPLRIPCRTRAERAFNGWTADELRAIDRKVGAGRVSRIEHGGWSPFGSDPKLSYRGLMSRLYAAAQRSRAA
jgi:hypothetical protein